MKRILFLILTAGFILCASSNAFALLFSVDASNSQILLSNVNEGDSFIGGSDISASLSTPYSNPYELADGESFAFEFASITLTGYGLFASGSADVQASLSFIGGDSPYNANGDVSYITMFNGFLDAGGLHWTK